VFSKIYKQAMDEITPNEDLKASLLKTAAEYKKPKVIPLYKYAATAAAVAAVVVSIKAVPYITNVNTTEIRSITTQMQTEAVATVRPQETGIPLQSAQMSDLPQSEKNGNGSLAEQKVTPKPKSSAKTVLTQSTQVPTALQAEAIPTAATEDTEVFVNDGGISNDEENVVPAAMNFGEDSGGMAAYSRMVVPEDELLLEECAPMGFEAVVTDEKQCSFVNGEARIDVSISKSEDFVGDRVDVGEAEVWKNGETYTLACGELCVQIINSGASDEAVKELIENIVK